MALTDLTRISTSGIATGTSLSGAILHGDAHFRGTQVGVTSALFDSSDNALEFNDNVQLKFGNSGDLRLYHDGSASHIFDNGTGDLRVTTNGAKIDFQKAGGEVLARFITDGSVDLYYDGSKKFQTTQSGSIVTGILTATGFSGPLSNPSGISTFYDLRVTNNLTVEGTTTTLDTNLVGVDRVEVGANSNSIVGVAVTQSGTADIVRLFDGASPVVTVNGVGRVGINTTTPRSMLDVKDTIHAGRAIHFDNSAWTGEVAGKIQLQSNFLHIMGGTNGVLFRNLTDGNVWEIDSHLSPVTDGKVNIGYSNRKVKTIYSDQVGIADTIFHVGDTNTKIRFPAADTVSVETGGSERLNLTASRLSLATNIRVNDYISHQSNDSLGVKFYNASGNNKYIGIGAEDDGTSTNHATFKIFRQGSAVTRLLLDSSGGFKFDGGNFTINDAIVHNHDPNTKIRFPAADTVTVETAGSERFRIDSSGRVLIGTTVEGEVNADDLTIATTGNTGITIRSGNTHNGVIQFSDGASGINEYAGFIDYDHNINLLKFGTNSIERLRIDNTGKATFTTPGGDDAVLVKGDNYTSVRIQSARDSSSDHAMFQMLGSRGTNASPTIVQSSDTLGTLSARGYDGNSYAQSSSINFGVDGTPGDGDMPGKITFSTSADGSESPTERLRITSAGAVMINKTSSFGTVPLQIKGTSSGLGDGSQIFDIATTDGSTGTRLAFGVSEDNFGWIRSYESGVGGRDIVFAASDEKMRIKSTGSVGIGLTNPEIFHAQARTLVLQENGHCGLTIDATSSTNSSIFFADGADGTEAYRGYVQYTHNDGTSSDYLTFGTAAAERLRIDSSGLIGIENTSPNLSLAGARNLVIGSGSGDRGLTIMSGTSGVGHIEFSDGTGSSAEKTAGGIRYYHNSNYMRFNTNGGTERLRITSSGRVGINQTAPQAMLQVDYDYNSSEIGLRLRAATGSGTKTWQLSEINGNAGVFTLRNASNGYNILNVDGTNQRIGINDTTPERTMDIKGSNCMLQLEGTGGNGRQWSLVSSDDATGTSVDGGPPGAFVIYDDTSSTRRFRIQSDGNSEINVSGGSFKAEGTGAYGISIHNTNSPSMGHLFIYGDNTLIRFRNSSNTYTARMGYNDSNNMLYFTNEEVGTSLDIVDDGVRIGDNKKFLCGNDRDLEILHNNSYGIMNNKSGHLYFQIGGNSRVLLRSSGSAGVDIYGEAAQNDSTSGARGVDLSVSGHQSVPVYFGTEHNAAQKSMYLSSYWIYLRGHVNEGIRFTFSQASGAPHGNIYSFKYNSATRPGGTTWDGFSDARAKENVVSITNGIDTIKKLRPVTFDWTNDYADSQGMYVMGKDENGGSVAKKENGYDDVMKNGKYGFIAQEYETVFPKDIRQDKYELAGTEIEDFKTINHDSLIPTLTAALKEAVAKIEVLEAKVAALEGS